MPTTKPNDKKIKEQFINNVQIGIAGPESSHLKDPHKAQNKEGSAAGKYQFTKYWLDKAGDKSIQNFAKKSKVFNVPQNMDDFKNDPMLQDAYFRYYAGEVLYPQAKKAYSGPNPKNLTLEEMGGLFHFKPPVDDKYGNTGVYKQIRTGVFDKGTKKGVDGASYTNMSSLGYLKKFSEHLEKNGGVSISKKDLIDSSIETKLTKEQVIEQYNQANESIDNNEYLTPQEKEIKRAALFQTVADSGNIDIINDYTEKENAKNQIEYTQKLKDYQDLVEVAQGMDITFTEDKDGKKTLGDKAFFKFYDNEDKATWKRLLSKYDIKAKGPNLLGNKTVDLKKFNTILEKQHLDLTGEKLSVNLDDETIISEDVGIIDRMFNTIPHKDNVSRLKFHKIAKAKNFAPKTIIDKEVFKPKKNEDKFKEEEVVEKETEKKKEVKTEEKKEVKTNEEANPNKGLANQFFKNELALNDVKGQDLKYTPGKKEIPVDAIVGLGLGIIGNDKAKAANIPLRTEDVSQAMRNYTADLLEKSKEGLPVEVEAQMKGMLADAYQGGLANIVNASGGNRATVLGNLGQLEQAKTKGLIGIQVADYEAKDRAFAQYGKAIEYINDFDTRRDIANHEIKFNEAKQKQQEGKQLATAGFSKMIDGLKYAKKTAPGSAYDMQRSFLMQKMFGYDPKAKDDGTGNQVGTKSWYENNKKVAKEKLLVTQNLHKTFQTLNPQQQEAVDNVIGTTQDPNVLAKVMEHVQQNGVDPKTVNPDRLNQAIKNNDMGLLSKASPTKQTAIKPSPLNPAAPIDNPIDDNLNITNPKGLIQGSVPEGAQMTDDPELIKKTFPSNSQEQQSNSDIMNDSQMEWPDNSVELPTEKEPEYKGLLNINEYTQQ